MRCRQPAEYARTLPQVPQIVYLHHLYYISHNNPFYKRYPPFLSRGGEKTYIFLPVHINPQHNHFAFLQSYHSANLLNRTQHNFFNLQLPFLKLPTTLLNKQWLYKQGQRPISTIQRLRLIIKWRPLFLRSCAVIVVDLLMQNILSKRLL